MAKDDYFVVAYKILAYLYIRLKHGEPALYSEMVSRTGKKEQ